MTIKTIDVQEVQHHLAEVLAQVDAGAEIIVMDGTTPRARLVPFLPVARPRVPGLHVGSIIPSADFDAPLPDDFWTGGA